MLVTNVALWAGLVVGLLMLLGVCYVYVARSAFGLGGVVLSVFGVVLMGLSIWKTVEITISANGDITAKFARLERQVNDLRTTTNQVRTNVEHLRTAVASTKQNLETKLADLAKTNKAITEKLTRTEKSLSELKAVRPDLSTHPN